jgi:YD repeat-containing protein
VIAEYYQNHREDYTYTEDGYLSTVSIGEDSYDTTSHTVVPMGSPVQRVRNERDALGRVVNYTEYAADGTTVTYSRALTYNSRSEITDETVLSRGATSVIHNDYKAESTANPGQYTGAYQGGVVTRSTTTSAGVTAETKTSYVWWDGARQGEVVYKPNVSAATTNRSSFAYDTTGRLSAVSIADGRSRTVTYVTNAEGHVLSRQEADYIAATGDPRQLRYQFDGRQLGDIGNDGPGDTDYVTAMAQRNASPNGPFQGGAAYGTPAADFDQSYDAINPTSEGVADSRITAQDGDTLRSIAAQMWGDESLWYLIAEANGLGSSDAIAGGMVLVIPAKVANFHNTSATFRLYDPNKAIGDITPNDQAQVKPQARANKGCGGVGKIIAVVIAVVVVAIVLGPASAAATNFFGGTVAAGATVSTAAAVGGAVVGGAIAGAAGSIASQGFSLAVGIQDKFSWKGVAMAAVAGGVGGGLSQFGGPGIVSSVVRGAAASVVTQGVAWPRACRTVSTGPV